LLSELYGGRSVIDSGPRAPRLFVAEDQDTIAFALRSYFTARGWSVVCTGSLHTAMTELAESLFDLAILDLRLGNDTDAGIVLAQHISETQEHTRMVLLTAYGSGEAQAKALAAGVDVVLDKPTSLAQLHDLACWLANGAAR
jgi:ActR/RegA family two-component response regulator